MRSSPKLAALMLALLATLIIGPTAQSAPAEVEISGGARATQQAVRIADNPPMANVAEPTPARLTQGTPTAFGAVDIDDELWITLGDPVQPGLSGEAIAIAEEIGATVVGGFSEVGIYQLRFDDPAAARRAKAPLENNVRVGSVAPSSWGGLAETALPPGDLDDDGEPGTWHWNMIDAPGAWDRSTGSTVSVGIIDVGEVYRDHEDLNARTASITPTRPSEHATHVAGLACAEANGIGVVGAAWGCPIVSSAVRSHGSPEFWYSAIGAMLAVLRDPDVRVINMSIGASYGRCATEQEGQAAEDWIRERYGPMFGQVLLTPRAQEVVWTVSAGNDCVSAAMSPMLVAASDQFHINNVVSVVAVDADGSRSARSNWWVGVVTEIAAPGGLYDSTNAESGVWSTSLQPCGRSQCSSYQRMAGTSQAAPLVAGVAALVAERYPSYTANSIISCMMNGARRAGRTATRPGADGFDPVLNAREAVRCDDADGLNITWNSNPSGRIERNGDPFPPIFFNQSASVTSSTGALTANGEWAMSMCTSRSVYLSYCLLVAQPELRTSGTSRNARFDIVEREESVGPELWIPGRYRLDHVCFRGPEGNYGTCRRARPSEIVTLSIVNAPRGF